MVSINVPTCTKRPIASIAFVTFAAIGTNRICTRGVHMARIGQAFVRI